MLSCGRRPGHAGCAAGQAVVAWHAPDCAASVALKMSGGLRLSLRQAGVHAGGETVLVCQLERMPQRAQGVAARFAHPAHQA